MLPSPNTASTTRNFANLIYDWARDKLVTFGPVVNGAYAAETWEWDATNGWAQVAAGGPTITETSFATYDAARDRQVLVSRANFLSPTVVHERAGSGPWVRNQNATMQGLRGPIVFDSWRNRVLLLAETGDLWAYSVPVPALWQVHGPGCAGSVGVPELTLRAPSSLAWLGGTLETELAHLPLGLGAIAMGFQDQTWNGQPLPRDLGAFGAPTCFVNIDVAASVLVFGSPAPHSLAIPATPWLLGQPFYQQAASFDPARNPLGVALSTSWRGVIGAR